MVGSVLDVVVDLRPSYSTFGKVFSTELSFDNRKQILIPAGFAHGFSVLSDFAHVLYKADKFFNQESEAGIYFDDPDLSIDWGIDKANSIISLKDKKLPLMADYIIKTI